jgi:metal-responsive CopG/Arc/MetJ family transcriptional regulator
MLRENTKVNTGVNTMAHRKTAITVPEDVMQEVDRAARERGESRSRFISRVLRLAVRARRDAEVTRRLDALFADESVREEQRREAQELAQLGINWDSERW